VASIGLAHQLFKLGKIKRATTIYNQALAHIRSGRVSEEICIRFFLRHAEALAILEEVSRR